MFKFCTSFTSTCFETAFLKAMVLSFLHGYWFINTSCIHAIRSTMVSAFPVTFASAFLVSLLLSCYLRWTFFSTDGAGFSPHHLICQFQWLSNCFQHSLILLAFCKIIKILTIHDTSHGSSYTISWSNLLSWMLLMTTKTCPMYPSYNLYQPTR